MRYRTPPRESPASRQRSTAASSAAPLAAQRGPLASTVSDPPPATGASTVSGRSSTELSPRSAAGIAGPDESGGSASRSLPARRSSRSGFGSSPGFEVAMIRVLPRSNQPRIGRQPSASLSSSAGDHDPSPIVSTTFPDREGSASEA